ncbi:MAG: WbqC family protein, partial [Thermodesulfobacteriota bacterium]
KYFQKINETRISDQGWAGKHWSSILHCYSKAGCFKEYRDLFEALYLECTEELLSRVNFRFISAICRILGIETKLSWSMDYELVEGQTERLVGLCKSARATHYVSGPAAKDYIDPGLFEREGIDLSYIDYSGYPEYTQLFGAFEHRVSIIDLIFNEGSDAVKYMKSD